MVRMDLLLDGATALLAREHGLRPEHFQGTHGRYMPFKVHSEGYATTAVQSYSSAKWRGDVVGPPALLLEASQETALRVRRPLHVPLPRWPRRNT